MNKIAKYVPNISYPRLRGFGVIFVLVITTNLVTNSFLDVNNFTQKAESLYLLDKASIHVVNHQSFETKVRSVSQKLEIPPEWLMAVMYCESKFDPSVFNHKGSGAVGLIQFMPATARELGTSVWKIQKMDDTTQINLVYTYLDNVRTKYGKFATLTDLYLAILFPKAVGQDNCFILYGKGTAAYRQNSGLDLNKDGYVMKSDITAVLERHCPKASTFKLKP